MPINFPSNTKVIIDEIRDAIGRTVTFYVENKTDCPACSINPITNESTNPFCIVCSGVGYNVTVSGTDILAHVKWGKYDSLGWVTGGQYREGDCHLQIEYTPEVYTLLDSAIYVVVDNVTLRIGKKELRGVPAINRILLDLDED